MPRVKRKQFLSEGCLEIVLPSAAFQSISDLSPGCVVILDGKSRIGDNDTRFSEDVSIEIQRRESSVCLRLFAAMMGEVFKKKVSKHWVCQLSGYAAEKRHQISDSSGKRSRTSSNRKVALEEMTLDEASQVDKVNAENDQVRDLWNKDDLEQSHLSNNDLLERVQSHKRVKVENDRSCLHYEGNSNVSGCYEGDVVDRTTAEKFHYNKQASTTHSDLDIRSTGREQELENARDRKETWRNEFENINCSSEGALSYNDTDCLNSETTNNIKEQSVSQLYDHCLGGDDDDDDKGSRSNYFSSSGDSEKKQHLRGFCCIFCNKNFADVPNPQVALERHMLRKCTRNPWSRDSVAPEPTVSDKYPLSCRFCPKAFETEKRLQSHQQKCPRDPEYMAQFDSSSLHLNICEVCDRLFANDRALMSHKVVSHGYPRAKVIPTKLLCRYCQMPFRCRGTKYHHETYKCGINPNVVQLTYCRICDRKMAKEKLDAHMKESHAKMERCICEICGAVFPSSRRLYTHKYIHKQKNEKYSCDICGRKFKMRYQMKRHLTTHTEERNIQCPVCGKCFKNKDQEHDHRMAVHEGRYKYRCSKCGHGMAKKIYLDSHRCGRVRRIQDGEKPVKLSKLKKTGTKSSEDCSLKSQHALDNEQMLRPSYFVLPDAVYQNACHTGDDQELLQQQLVPSAYENFMVQNLQSVTQSMQSGVQSIQTPVQSVLPCTVQPSLQSLVQPVVQSSVQTSLQSSVPAVQSSVLYHTAQSVLQSSADPSTQQALHSSVQSSVQLMLDSSLQNSMQPLLQSSV